MGVAQEFAIAFIFAMVAGGLFEAIKSKYTVDFEIAIKKRIILYDNDGVT